MSAFVPVPRTTCGALLPRDSYGPAMETAELPGPGLLTYSLLGRLLNQALESKILPRRAPDRRENGLKCFHGVRGGRRVPEPGRCRESTPHVLHRRHDALNPRGRLLASPILTWYNK